jgi:5-methylcytosine-specific restriction endonuclease McrA
MPPPRRRSEPRWSGDRVTAMRRRVQRMHGSTCAICHKPIDPTLKWPDPQSFTIDHITPRSHGGAIWDIANMQPAHLSCNSRKGNRADTATGRAGIGAGGNFWTADPQYPAETYDNPLNTSRAW